MGKWISSLEGNVRVEIRCGLPGTPMASFSETAFSDEDLWSLVDFVRSLSRP